MKTKHIVVGLTGSIACYKACDIISSLKKSGFTTTAVMTKEAMEFIAPLTLQTISGNKVITDMFELPADYNPLHTCLAEGADLILIAPATANIIGKLANGISDDILTCTVLASKAKVLIAPAMNQNMWNHPSTKKNIQTLKGFGYKFIGPIKGHLACGYEGMGHLAKVKDIARQAKRMLAK